MSNTIIKSFNINPDAGDIQFSGNYLYVNLTLTKSEISLRGVKYIKICILNPEDLKDKNYLQSGYEKSYRKNNYRNYNLLNQNVYDYLTVNVDSSNDLYQDFVFPLHENKLVQGLGLQSIDDLDLITRHVFKIYFLSENKNIIEKYSYTQSSNVSISDYKNELIEDELSTLLLNNIDIDFRDYDENFENGPVIFYTDDYEDVNEDDIKLDIFVNERSFTFNNIRIFSSRIISIFESNIIYNMFDYLINNPLENSIDLEINFSYRNKSFLKEKFITKNKVLSLYNSYFKKHKEKFAKKYFNEKIKVDGNTISFTKPDLSYFPESVVSSSLISIKKNDLSNISLYTNPNLDSEYELGRSAGGLYGFEVIYNNLELEESNLYYIKLNTGEIIVKYGEIQIYPAQESLREVPIPVNPAEVLPRSYRDLFNASNRNISINDFAMIMPNNNIVITEQESPVGPRRSAEIISRLCLTNARIEKENIITDLNLELLRNKSSLFKEIGFENENNDYLNNEIFDDTIVCYTMQYKNGNEVYEKKIHKLLSEAIVDSKIKIPLNEALNVRNNQDITFDIETITLPKDSCKKIFGGKDVSDSEKESFAKFLCESYPESYHKVIDLIDNNLYEKSSGKRRSLIFKKIFDISKRKRINYFNLRKNTQKITEKDVSVSNLKTLNNFLSKSYLENNLKNISKQNLQDKKSFKFYSSYKEEGKSIKIFKKKKDRIIASFDLNNYKTQDFNYSEYSINVSTILTFAFDKESFNSQNKDSTNIKENKYLLDEDTCFIFKNLDFKIINNTLKILSPVENSTLELTNQAYEKLNSFWGQNGTLCIKNILEKYLISFSGKNGIEKTISVNNFIKKDYSLKTNSSTKTYVLNSKLHMPNIVLSYN